MTPRTKQIIMTAVVLASGAAISILKGSHWHWAPIALALVVELDKVLGIVEPVAKP